MTRKLLYILFTCTSLRVFQQIVSPLHIKRQASLQAFRQAVPLTYTPKIDLLSHWTLPPLEFTMEQQRATQMEPCK